MQLATYQLELKLVWIGKNNQTKTTHLFKDHSR